MTGRSGILLYRVGLATAIVAFGGYFAVTALGDLFPLEQFGAEFVTTSQAATIQQVAPGSPADRAGLLVGDQILTIEGRPIRNALDWASVFARVEEEKPLLVTLLRDGSIEQHEVFFRPRPHGPWGSPQGVVVVLTRLVQLVTLTFGIALAVRANGPTAVLGFWLLATFAIYSVGLPPRMAVVWRQMPLPLEILFYLPAVSKALIGFIFFVFFRALLRLPLSGVKGLIVALPFVAIGVWHVIFNMALLHRPQMLPGLTGFLPLVIVVNVAYVLAALVTLGLHYRTLRDPSDRRRLRWIVAGSVLGCAAGMPTVAGLWLGVNDPTLIYHAPLGLQLSYTAFLVMPASFWWAIAKGQLFDIEFVVRRGLQHVFARRALLVITPAVIAALAVEAALHEDESLRQILRAHAVLYLGAATVLIVFRSRRASWLDALDRRLFRERYDACQLLRDVATQVRASPDLKMAADCAVAQIDAALHPQSIAVYTCDSADASLHLLTGHATDTAWPRRTGLMEIVRTHGKPIDVATGSRSWLVQHLPSDEVEFLRRAKVRLIVPVVIDPAGPEAIFVLGTKRSGEPYSKEDRNLLQAVAESVGVLVSTIASRGVDGHGEPESSWDGRLWSLADAVARGSRVDWTKESTDIVGEERRQVLLELQALERLMQVHGASADGLDDAAEAAASFDRWGYFELRGRIGAGRFGSVYRAWDPKLEREVAIKLLNVAGVDRAAYLREARHLARVRHPNVVHVYGAEEMDDVPGFWMELVEGQTLGEILRERGPFGVEEAVAVGGSLCRALTAIHRVGLVHQDVKAQNVMREHDGRLVLMDLGAGTNEADRPQWGTPCYMAPELFDGGGASAPSDLYSLGVLLFFLLTTKFPVDGGSYEEIAAQHRRGDRRRLGELRTDLPSAFVDAIDRALAADPASRFLTADDLSTAIRAEVV